MRVPALALLPLAACAAPQFTARASLTPHRFEAKMLEDARDNRAFDAMAPESAAMIVGGPADPAEVGQAIVLMRKKLAPVVAAAKAVNEAERPRRLLELLYEDLGAGGPVLVDYVKGATALYDAVSTGRYNCVSSAIVYAIAAQSLGIDARPYVMPEHARITVYQGGQAFIVETTNKHGFDPPPDVQKEVRRQVRNSSFDDLDKMDPHGEEVDFIGLIGFVYTNMGNFFLERGDTPMTQALLERGEALMPTNAKDLVREQVATALTWLSVEKNRTIDDSLSLAEKALSYAQRERTKQIIAGNVAYFVNTALYPQGKSSKISQSDLALWQTRLAPFGKWRFTALAYAQVAASRHVEAEGSIDQALRQCTKTECDELRALDLFRLSDMSAGDATAAAESFFRRYDVARLPSGRDLQEHAKVIAHNQVNALDAQNQCEKIVPSQRPWAELGLHGYAKERAEVCFQHRGFVLIEKKDYEKAATELRVALKQFEKSQGIRGNLVVAIARQADALVQAKRCQDAKALLEEGKRLDPSDKWFNETLAWCKRN